MKNRLIEQRILIINNITLKIEVTYNKEFLYHDKGYNLILKHITHDKLVKIVHNVFNDLSICKINKLYPL